MITTTGVFHTSIPVDDIDRAERFYTEILGMKLGSRVGQEGTQVSRLLCGADSVLLFERPRALRRDSHAEDGLYHQAFEVPLEAFDEAVESLKNVGAYHQITDRSSGRTAYFWDTEGNYEELHASRPQS